MNRNFRLILFFLFTLSVFACLASEGSEKIEGPYLGETPPLGSSTKIFAPGIISTKEGEGCSAFSLHSRLFIFRRFSETPPDIYMMEQVNGQWTEPQIVPFQGEYRTGDFTMAPDGKTLYFTSNRPLEGKGQTPRSSGDIWKIEKRETGWSEPQSLGPVINTHMHESYPSVTRDGTLYFFRRESGDSQGETADIYRSRLVNGKYTEVQNLGKPINTKFHEWDPFIAPDESYLIFCSTKPGGEGEDDIYISFHQEDDSWTEPVNMGTIINSPGSENRPYVTPDGLYFFFTSTRDTPTHYENIDSWKQSRARGGKRDIYWANAKLLETYRPESFPQPAPRGKYMGQKTPGLTPEVFAKGIVSTHKKELSAAFSPDGKEFFFTRHLIHLSVRKYVIMHMKELDGQWTKPEVASFSGKYPDVDPSFSPDGKKLFFASHRPVPGSTKITGSEIWIVDKLDNGWSEPYHIGPPLSSFGAEAYPILTKKNTFYFITDGMGGQGNGDIFYSKYVEGQFSQPKSVGDSINSIFMEIDGLVDHEENFLVFCSDRYGGSGRSDLYISFRKKDGSWTMAQNMGNTINTDNYECTPMLSPDQKYLFFCRIGKDQYGYGDIYWVDVKVIENLKPKDI